jgi:hypothetical protein
MAETDLSPLPIRALIEARCDGLGLSHADLVRRAGYRNVGKGIRRLEALMSGNLTLTKLLIDALQTALDLSPDVVECAIEETRRAIDKAEAEARAEAIMTRPRFHGVATDGEHNGDCARCLFRRQRHLQTTGDTACLAKYQQRQESRSSRRQSPWRDGRQQHSGRQTGRSPSQATIPN